MLTHPTPLSETTTESTTPVASDDDLLIAYLAQRQVLCPACKYDLRNLKNCECPECGRKLSLSVTAAEPSQGPFVLLVVSLGIASGLGIPSFIFIVHGALRVLSEGAMGLLAGLSLIYFTCSIPIMFIMAVNRSLFLKLDRSVQQAWAGGVAICTALLIFIDLIAIFGGL